jgi:hypothetical protein
MKRKRNRSKSIELDISALRFTKVVILWSPSQKALETELEFTKPLTWLEMLDEMILNCSTTSRLFGFAAFRSDLNVEIHTNPELSEAARKGVSDYLKQRFMPDGWTALLVTIDPVSGEPCIEVPLDENGEMVN